MNATKSTTAVFSKIFTDDPLTPQVTVIKAVHVTDLRAAIDTLRSHYRELPTFQWTDPGLTPGVTPVRGVHLTELRAAPNETYLAASRPHPSYTDPTITGGQTVVKEIHLGQLRTSVRGLE